jgi:hypothetical protein
MNGLAILMPPDWDCNFDKDNQGSNQKVKTEHRAKSSTRDPKHELSRNAG